MMYCTKCEQHKEDWEFYNKPYERMVAFCMKCRAALKEKRREWQAQNAIVTQARIAENRRKFVAAIDTARKQFGWNRSRSNLVPVRDIALARAVARAFKDNPSLGNLSERPFIKPPR